LTEIVEAVVGADAEDVPSSIVVDLNLKCDEGGGGKQRELAPMLDFRQQKHVQIQRRPRLVKVNISTGDM
jgi:hypothetical protein